jgi:hypothetical protein
VTKSGCQLLLVPFVCCFEVTLLQLHCFMLYGLAASCRSMPMAVMNCGPMNSMLAMRLAPGIAGGRGGSPATDGLVYSLPQQVLLLKLVVCYWRLTRRDTSILTLPFSSESFMA